jgi:nitroreductase
MKEAHTLAIHPLLQKRFSPKGFADTPWEQEKIELLFEAARLAPSSLMSSPGGLYMPPEKIRRYTSSYSTA